MPASGCLRRSSTRRSVRGHAIEFASTELHFLLAMIGTEEHDLTALGSVGGCDGLRDSRWPHRRCAEGGFRWRGWEEQAAAWALSPGQSGAVRAHGSHSTAPLNGANRYARGTESCEIGGSCYYDFRDGSRLIGSLAQISGDLVTASESAACPAHARVHPSIGRGQERGRGFSSPSFRNHRQDARVELPGGCSITASSTTRISSRPGHASRLQ